MTVRVGIIGTGWVARDRHIPAFRSHSDVDLVAVYDRNPQRGDEVARDFRIPNHFDALEPFLAFDLDVVSIAAPPWTHAELALAALGAGCHVFTEKPLAMTEVEARSMYESAERARRYLCVSHNLLWSRSVRKARAFLGSSPVHFAMAVQLSSLHRRLPDWYRELPGGLAFDEMPHLLYLLRDFLGGLEVDAVRPSPRDESADAGSIDILVSGPDAPGSITMVVGAPVSEWHVTVVGQEAVVAMDLFRDIAIRVTSDREHRSSDVLRTSARAVAQHVGGFASSGARYMSRRLLWGHERLGRAFIDCVLGRGPLPVSPAEALDVVHASDRIIESLSTASPIAP